MIDTLTVGSATPHPLVLADMNMLSGHRFRWPRRPAINDMERLPYQLMMNQIIAALEDGRYERGTEFRQDSISAVSYTHLRAHET